MNVMKSVTFVAVATFAAAACAVQVDYAGKDPAAKFAASELGRILKGSAGRIALREDPAMAAQAWRIKCAADGTLVGMVRFNADKTHWGDHYLRQTVSRDGGKIILKQKTVHIFHYYARADFG